MPTSPTYLIIHKDTPINLAGMNGGAEMATLALAEHLARSGRQVVLAAMFIGQLSNSPAFQIRELGPRYNTSGVLNEISAQGPYVLISSGRGLPLVQSTTDKQCCARILTLHDRHGSDVGLKLQVMSHYVDKIVCVSAAHAEELKIAGAAPEKLKIVHNGVDLNTFTPSPSSSRNWRKIVFAGALVQDKGIHLLLQSYAELKGSFHDLSLDIYGSAGLWGREEIFDAKRLEQQLPGIKFHGAVTPAQLAPAFQSAGMLVFPSIWFETFGLVIAEALATGCPVVAFDVGGPRESVRDRENGLLLKEISPESLTRSLRHLLTNSEDLRRMSEQALNSRDRFSWDKTAWEIIGLCE